MSSSSYKSFTLIEVLVVAFIGGILISIVAMAMNGARAKARDARRSAEINQIRKALSSYYIYNGKYPTTTGWVSLEDTNNTESLKVRKALEPNYLSVIPKDPRWPHEYEKGGKYSYRYIATTTDNYELYAKREEGGYFKLGSEEPVITYTMRNPSGWIGEGCFLAGTKVLMADGSYLNIEQIKIGDMVKSYDETNNKVSLGKVTEVIKRSPAEGSSYYLLINGKIRVTPGQSVFVNGKWAKANNIHNGDVLTFGTRYRGKISSIRRIFRREPTYDLKVEPYYNFFIGYK